MNNTFSPIVLFVYNRAWHTQQTIESLQKNELATKSHLIIYSDAPKDSSQHELVNEVRKYIYTIDGFKEITIVERETNFGLAKSIIEGVTEVVNKYGKIIVLEDDLVTSPFFLNFMNNALDTYIDQKKVWHISGWNYPINPDGLSDTFLWRTMNCWGWATWRDRWQHYQKNTTQLISELTNNDIKRFNLDGKNNFWRQVLDNKSGKINTWAIFWYATIFKQGGLCLNPTETYVRNIGLDDSGENCIDNDTLNAKMSRKSNVSFENEVNENPLAVQRIKAFYTKENQNLFKKGINRFKQSIKKYKK